MALTRAHEKQLEQMLGRPAPAEYLRLLRAFPPLLAKQLAARGSDAEQPLFRAAATVLQENRLAREEDIWTTEGPWPARHLMIGAEIGGDKFTLHATSKPMVFRLLHENGTLERIGSLSSYLRAVRRWLNGDAATITQALSPARKKKERPWELARKKMAAKAPAQERKAKRTNDPDDWGDATLFHEAGGRFDDALRCCERWIALSGRERFPRSVRVRLEQQRRKSKTG